MSFIISYRLDAANIIVEVKDVSGKAVSDIVVFLEPLENQNITNIKSSPFVIYQSDKKFSPYISVVQNEIPLTFSNKDNITHHIYSVSTKNRFSFRLTKGQNKTIENVSVKGKILMGCNIHDWMSGYIFVLDTPLFNKTNTHGESVLEVPVIGAYNLSIWHPQLMEAEQTVTRQIIVEDGKHYQVQLTSKMADIPDQSNPDSFDFIEDY